MNAYRLPQNPDSFWCGKCWVYVACTTGHDVDRHFRECHERAE